MMEYYVQIEDNDGVKELIQYLRQNKVKYDTSDLGDGGKHFEIYCDKNMAYKIDIALDLIFDHIACKNEKLCEADQEGKEYIKKAMQDNATYKKAKSIAEKYGYIIDPHCYVEVFNNGHKWINFRVRGKDRYDPEIYYDAPFGQQEYKFRIQTTSYGSLELDEYEQFLKKVTAAYDMVKELTKLDFYTLYEVPYKED